MNKFECSIETTIDDAGVAYYYAIREEDYDTQGIPMPSCPMGCGETELEAVIDLCQELLDYEQQAAELRIAQDCSADDDQGEYNPYLLSGEELKRAENAACEF